MTGLRSQLAELIKEGGAALAGARSHGRLGRGFSVVQIGLATVLLVSTGLLLLVWTCFALIGTALYVFYKNSPSEALEGVQPEEVFPHFLLTHVPAGVAGFVLGGLLAASMSTLDSSINSSAATVTTDFYRRFRRSVDDESHYLLVGRIASVFFATIMVCVSLAVHYTKTEEGGTLMDFQTVVYPIVSTGILSLFLLGFLTRRVGSGAAGIATVSTLVLVVGWVWLDSVARRAPPPEHPGDLADFAWLPDIFWIGVLSTVFLLVVGYGLAFLFPPPPKENVENFTIWTEDKHS